LEQNNAKKTAPKPSFWTTIKTFSGIILKRYRHNSPSDDTYTLPPQDQLDVMGTTSDMLAVKLEGFHRALQDGTARQRYDSK
jgi:hypothetical protein